MIPLIPSTEFLASPVILLGKLQWDGTQLILPYYSSSDTSAPSISNDSSIDEEVGNKVSFPLPPSSLLKISLYTVHIVVFLVKE